MSDQSRRSFIKGSGAAIAGAVGLGMSGSAAAAVGDTKNGWTVVESPTQKTLKDVTHTFDGPVAVGGGGDVVQRQNSDDFGSVLSGDIVESEWERVLDAGPSASKNTLNSVDTTDDGVLAWFAGSSGAIGSYNVITGEVTDYTAPKGKTSTWESISVTGMANESEQIYAFNGSGEELTGTRQDDGSIQWDETQKPGGGSTIPASSFWSDDEGMICDTSQGAYQTTDGGKSWTKIGVPNSGVAFNGISAVGTDDANIAAGSGKIYRYDGNRWTPLVVGEKSVRDIDRDGERGLGSGGSGEVFKRETLGGWTSVETPTTSTLLGVSLDPTEVSPDVAVGSGSTIIERR